MDDLTSTEFTALARLLGAEADTLRDAFALELADILHRVERRLPGVIAQARSESAVATSEAARLGRLRVNLRRLLREAGYDDLVDASVSVSLTRTLTLLAETSPAYRRALAFDASGRPTAFTGLLRALIETARADVLGQGDAIATVLWRATARGVLGADTPERLIQALGELLDGEVNRAAALYDTNVSIVQRIAVQTIVPTDTASLNDGTSPLATGGDILPVPDDQLYGYVGPVDAIVRPFCLEHLGRVYTKAEIDALDNDQLPDPFITGGGYGCRHLWAPISRFDDAAALHGTASRLPEVEAELQRINPEARQMTRRRRVRAA